jgi:hypothetical protein
LLVRVFRGLIEIQLHTSMKPHRGPLSLVFGSLSIGSCLALLMGGCGGDRHDLEVVLETLTRSPDGKVWVVSGSRRTNHTFAPDGAFGEGWAVGTTRAPEEEAQSNVPPRTNTGVSQSGQRGSFSVRVVRVSSSSATLEVSFSVGVRTNLDLALNAPQDVFDASGLRGRRITLNAIRASPQLHKPKTWSPMLVGLSLLILLLAWKRQKKPGTTPSNCN